MSFKYLILFFLLFIPNNEKQEINKFDAFENLIGKTWIAEGHWADQSKFKQEIRFEYNLNKSIIICKSKGFTNAEQTEYGARNHGIRQFDSELGKIRFWEFDVFGSLTEGTVDFEGKNIIYQYQYHGSNITDMWEYVNDSLYNFKVGVYNHGTWEQVFLSSQFREKH